MQNTENISSVTIKVISLEQKPAAGLRNITECFDDEKRSQLVKLLRSSSSVRNIAYYRQMAVDQMTAQLIAETKQTIAKNRQAAQATRKSFRLLSWVPFFRKSLATQTQVDERDGA